MRQRWAKARAQRLPASRAPLEQAALGGSALRELSRVAVRETQAEWLKLASGKTVRQLEELVAGVLAQGQDVPPLDMEARVISGLCQLGFGAGECTFHDVGTPPAM